MTDKNTHCCEQMQNQIATGELHLVYLPKFREYGIDYADGGTSLQVINFCPWCGSKLPSPLRTQWFAQLDRLGLELEDELPAELKSDVWWRNNGKLSAIK